MFVAGIDGGGTSAKLELRFPDEQRVVRRLFGPLNITASAREAYAQRLREIFHYCGDMSECVSLCIGGAGVTKSETGEVVREELRTAGFHGVLKLCGDHEIALRGAINGPGCVLIAGTGSIAYGINETGRDIRVGGYGHLIDDCGSGYAIGRDALSLAVKTLDGRIKPNSLADAVLKAVGVHDGSGVVNYVYSAESKTKIAALAPVVIDSARSGESYSVEILDRNSDDLVHMAETLLRGLHLFSPRVALTGGLLDHANVYQRMTEEKLSKIAEVVKPQHDAAFGAAALAEDAVR